MKFLKYALLLALLPMALYATAPTYAAVDGIYMSALDTSISSSTAFDTLTNNADSLQLITAYEPVDGWEYFISFGAFTGTGADTMNVAINVDCYDQDGNKLMRLVVDTIDSPEGQSHLLQFRSVIPGVSFKVWLHPSLAAATTQVIVNQVSIFRRRPMNIQKRGF